MGPNKGANSSPIFLRGHNIGIRLVDEFLAKARMGKCSSFRETAEVIAKQAFVMFINVQATVTNWSQDARECSLVRTLLIISILVSCSSCKQLSSLPTLNVSKLLYLGTTGYSLKANN